MAFKPTEMQEKAIIEKGSILVSAAAGSGKTAVLVERVIGLLTDEANPIPADRLLIVTFTNAAAAEMRSRIEKRLFEECAKKPLDIGLKKQKYLISSAKICTIDSFCIDLVRENFERLGVNPDFKISDTESLEILSQRVIFELINQKLEEENPDFLKLLELTGCEFDEKNLAQAVRTVFSYSMQMPFPDLFLDNLLVHYKEDFGKENYWYKKAFRIAENSLSKIKELVMRGVEEAALLADADLKYTDYFCLVTEKTEKLSSAIKAYDWDLVRDEITSFELSAVPYSKKLAGRPEYIALKSIKDGLDEQINGIKKIFFASSEEISSQNQEIFAPIDLFIGLIKEYSSALLKAQLEDNTLTFYNTEQMALSLLCKTENGEIKLREDAHLFYERFDEILVDEFQDVNDLQNMLFYALSNKEKKLFAVGDVKQSIYGFRGANPNNFLQKKNKYISIDKATDNDSKKIILANNFRSRKEVCDYINFLFRNLMNEHTGKIIYNSEEALIATSCFAEIDFPTVEMLLADNINSSNKDRLTVEADIIAMQIKKIIGSGKCIHTKDGGLRNASYSDFAILLRSTATSASKISEVLKNQGVPVSYSNESFSERLEIETFLSLLKIIDNPADDIALVTVMMSPIFSFTAEELAEIRAETPYGDFISAVYAFSGESEHIKKFKASLLEYRSYAAILPVSSLIFKLINITEYGNIVLTMSDGEQRRSNLLKLAEYAAKYQESSNGISGFIKYIRNNASSLSGSAKNNSRENSVKIMSIHASKGLQFPVCIIANIDSKFNMRDTSDSMLFSEENGIGFRYYDEKLKYKRDTLTRLLISNEMREKTLEEELRLLYVALTRAEDRIVFVGAYKNLQKKLMGLSSNILSDGGQILNSTYSSASSFDDWILSSMLLHPNGDILRKYCDSLVVPQSDDSKINIRIIDAPSIEDKAGEEAFENTEINEEITEQLKNNLSFIYPFEKLRTIESKCSVSALANKAENEKFAFSSLPAFMESDGLGAAAKGTAIHKAMQFIKFQKDINIEEEIERLKEWEFISEAEAEAVDIRKLENFFNNEIFFRILKSDDVRREMRFLTEIDAGRLDKTLDEALLKEKIVVQGAVDLCFAEADGIVLLDFKTDHVSEESSLINAYSEQLNIYSEACEKIFAKPVKEKIIYSFALDKCILIDKFF